MLELKGRDPVATGQHRLIFDDPGDPARLIKVMIPSVVAKKFDAPGRWHKRLARARQYGGYLREIREYIALQARAGVDCAPIARTLGLVETDYGLGLQVEKFVGADGRLAPTLLALVREHGRAPWIVQALEDWLQRIIAGNVILGDLHARNLVLASANDAAPRFVMVDGYGEKNFIPRCSMSQSFNRWHSKELYRRLLVNVVRQVAQERALPA